MRHLHGSIRESILPVTVEHLGMVDYCSAWDQQAELVQRRADSEIDDTVLILEHPSTYTAGKRTQPEDRPTNGLPVIEVDRGGRITWHGPGQLVAYPIIKLAPSVDVVEYVRRIEDAVLATCRQLGLNNVKRISGRSGVWLPADSCGGISRPARKIAAIGIRVTRNVTMHGVAINCDNTLDFYDHIVPCGLKDASVSTLTAELGRRVSVSDITGLFTGYLRDSLDDRIPSTHADITGTGSNSAEVPPNPRRASFSA